MTKSHNLEKLDLDEFRQVAIRLSNPDEAALAKSILGKNYNGYKAIVNTLGKASEVPGSNFALLAMRGKEIGTPVLGATAIISGVAAAAPVITTGLAVFLSPVMMARYVTNKNRVSKFLGLANKNLDFNTFAQKATVLANDVYKELSEEDKEKIDKYLTFGLLEDDDDNQEEQ